MSALQRFINHPAGEGRHFSILIVLFALGPKTIFFWAPTFKWVCDEAPGAIIPRVFTIVLPMLLPTANGTANVKWVALFCQAHTL